MPFCGFEDDLSNRILVAYASRYGSTAEIAQAIGKVLSDDATVDVLSMTEVADPAAYDAAVVGAPIYSSDWMPEATEWVKSHGPAWKKMRTACFVVSLRLRDVTQEIRTVEEAAINVEKVILNPVSVGLFAGALDYSKLGAIVKLQVQTKGLPEGDFRDWAAIRSWAAEIKPLLLPEY